MDRSFRDQAKASSTGRARVETLRLGRVRQEKVRRAKGSNNGSQLNWLIIERGVVEWSIERVCGVWCGVVWEQEASRGERRKH